MSLLGHWQWLSALTTILLTVHNFSHLCESKLIKDNSDLMYSDSSHGPQTAAAHQQVVFIDHGGGAISQIRRTSFPSVPSFPFGPHVQHYPNPIFEHNFADEPNHNFPEDIPRIFERRDGPPSTPNPIAIGPQLPPQPQPVLHNQPINQHIPHPFAPHIPQLIPQPIPQPIPHSHPQPIPQQSPPLIPQSVPPHIPQPIPQHFSHQFPNHIPQPIQHYFPQPVPQPIAAPNPNVVSQPLRQPIEPDIEDERFLIHNEIERIPKPSNEVKPSRREPPPPPPPPPVQDSPFFNFGPEIFSGFDSPFDPFGPQNTPLFQRRRLTSNNNQIQDQNPNSIGYPSYTYYKGGGDENPALTNWPKIFKFTDGRHDLFEFEKQKKQNKIKFSSKETYFDHISRDSFLILHGGTFAQ